MPKKHSHNFILVKISNEGEDIIASSSNSEDLKSYITIRNKMFKDDASFEVRSGEQSENFTDFSVGIEDLVRSILDEEFDISDSPSEDMIWTNPKDTKDFNYIEDNTWLDLKYFDPFYSQKKKDLEDPKDSSNKDLDSDN